MGYGLTGALISRHFSVTSQGGKSPINICSYRVLPVLPVALTQLEAKGLQNSLTSTMGQTLETQSKAEGGRERT